MTSKQTFWHGVAEAMKAKEDALRQRINTEQWTLVRLDGRKFSTFTKGWQKPFDARLIAAMRAAMADLLTEFNPVIAYTQSDEITLVWPPIDPAQPERTFIFDGQVQKLCSVMASFCSVRFGHHLAKQSYALPQEQRLIDKLPTAHFDARVFQLDTAQEVGLNLMWRVHDFKRNSMNNLGFAYLGHKKMHGLKPKEVIASVETECNVRWRELPSDQKFGTFCKKRLIHVDAIDRKTQQSVQVLRAQIVFASFDLPGTEAREPLLLLLEKGLAGDLSPLFAP